MKPLVKLLRRSLLLSLSPLMLALPLSPVMAEAAPGQAAPRVTVHKSPYCGCCKDWIDYLERNGFEVVANDTHDMEQIKKRFHVPGAVASCHTAVVDGYVVEGHVPVNDIRRLLRERPAVVGISAPGMPQDSPGMGSETPRGYNVVTFTEQGEIDLYSRY
jgi:hypothetical protein